MSVDVVDSLDAVIVCDAVSVVVCEIEFDTLTVAVEVALWVGRVVVCVMVALSDGVSCVLVSDAVVVPETLRVVVDVAVPEAEGLLEGEGERVLESVVTAASEKVTAELMAIATATIIGDAALHANLGDDETASRFAPVQQGHALFDEVPRDLVRASAGGAILLLEPHDGGAIRVNLMVTCTKSLPVVCFNSPNSSLSFKEMADITSFVCQKGGKALQREQHNLDFIFAPIFSHGSLTKTKWDSKMLQREVW